jgi:hypothetical protein
MSLTVENGVPAWVPRFVLGGCFIHCVVLC